MFVALHELSHIMTKSLGHTPEFWNNFRFALREALKIKIYKYQDFNSKSKKYCGILITDTPYKMGVKYTKPKINNTKSCH